MASQSTAEAKAVPLSSDDDDEDADDSYTASHDAASAPPTLSSPNLSHAVASHATPTHVPSDITPNAGLGPSVASTETRQLFSTDGSAIVSQASSPRPGYNTPLLLSAVHSRSVRRQGSTARVAHTVFGSGASGRVIRRGQATRSAVSAGLIGARSWTLGVRSEHRHSDPVREAPEHLAVDSAAGDER